MQRLSLRATDRMLKELSHAARKAPAARVRGKRAPNG